MGEEPTREASPVAAEADPENPFDRWSSEVLDNGTRVWVAPFPDSGVIRVLAFSPGGYGELQPERLETAHLLEHVLIAAGGDGSEAERKQAVEVLGGSHNAHTRRQRTWYWVEVPAGHADFAIDWMAETVQTLDLSEAHVDGERTAVRLERGTDFKHGWSPAELVPD